MSATLQLVRDNIIMELRRGTFDIVVDGRSVGSVDPHQETDLPIGPGHHSVQVRSGRYSSGTHNFDIADGGVATFRCSGARIWPIYLASMVKTDIALVLKRVS